MSEPVSNPVFEATYAVSFGDCDPVGIVFYPHIFSWFDRTFHAYLKVSGGGHAAICETLKARGIGLTSAECKFRRPVKEGDDLTVRIGAVEWRERSFLVIYEGRVGEAVAFQGEESRVLFIEKDGRMSAGELAPLKALLREANDG